MGAELLLSVVLALTTALLCYAGYIFLIVDRRQESSMLADKDLFDAIDNKNYDFELPEEIEEYEELRESQPGDKRALPMALLKRAMADIPRIEQLERDHPRMARLFQKGLLPFGIWEQLVDAEAMMDTEVSAHMSVWQRLSHMRFSAGSLCANRSRETAEGLGPGCLQPGGCYRCCGVAVAGL